MAALEMLDDGKTVRYPLVGEQIVIGRNPGNGIQLESATLSGSHARLVREGRKWIVEDLGSRNGTFVNGTKVAQHTDLREGDQIEVGGLKLKFVADGPVHAPATTTVAIDLATTDNINSKVRLDFASDEDDSGPQILGAVEHQGRFGLLGAQPEAKLKAVLEINSALAGTMDVKDVLPRILETLFHIFRLADRGCILLRDEQSGEMVPRAFQHRHEDDDSTVRLSRTIVEKVLSEKTGILTADASADTQFGASQSIADLSIRSMMCVPMLGLNSEPVGLISIDSQSTLGQFTQDDLDLLLAIAGQAALSYENARLLASYVANQKKEVEMQLSRDVQLALLPQEFPEIDGYEFFASYEAADAVGGDYYDFVMLEDDKICLALGDVAGQGLSGALIMARLCSAVESALEISQDAAEAVVSINNHMCRRAVEGRFVTFILAIIDCKTHELSLVNAGHSAPWIRRPNGNTTLLHGENIGPQLGVVEDYPYESSRHKLQPGETLVIITDGVDEALNPSGEPYSKKRIVDVIRQTQTAAKLGESLLADVRRHAGGRPQNDDITILTFGRQGP